jgi:hypothetical protein
LTKKFVKLKNANFNTSFFLNTELIDLNVGYIFDLRLSALTGMVSAIFSSYLTVSQIFLENPFANEIKEAKNATQNL